MFNGVCLDGVSDVEHITGVHNNDELASDSVTARSSVAIAEISSINSKVRIEECTHH